LPSEHLYFSSQNLLALLSQPNVVQRSHLQWLRLIHIILFFAAEATQADLPHSPWGGLLSTFVPLYTDLGADTMTAADEYTLIHHKLNGFSRKLLVWWTVISGDPKMVLLGDTMSAPIRRLRQEVEMLEGLDIKGKAALMQEVEKCEGVYRRTVKTVVIPLR
jgi:hypothetical protein